MDQVDFKSFLVVLWHIQSRYWYALGHEDKYAMPYSK